MTKGYLSCTTATSIRFFCFLLHQLLCGSELSGFWLTSCRHNLIVPQLRLLSCVFLPTCGFSFDATGPSLLKAHYAQLVSAGNLTLSGSNFHQSFFGYKKLTIKFLSTFSLVMYCTKSQFKFLLEGFLVRSIIQLHLLQTS